MGGWMDGRVGGWMDGLTVKWAGDTTCRRARNEGSGKQRKQRRRCKLARGRVLCRPPARAQPHAPRPQLHAFGEAAAGQAVRVRPLQPGDEEVPAVGGGGGGGVEAGGAYVLHLSGGHLSPMGVQGSGGRERSAFAAWRRCQACTPARRMQSLGSCVAVPAHAPAKPNQPPARLVVTPHTLTVTSWLWQ